MDDVGLYLWYGFLTLLFSFFTISFSIGETVITMLSKSKLRKLFEEGDEKAKQILPLKENQFEFSLKSNINTYIAASFASAFLSWQLIMLYGNIVDSVNHTYQFFYPANILIIIISVFLIFAFTVFLPKRLVYNSPDKYALFITTIVKPLTFIFEIVSFIPLSLSKGFAKLFGVKSDLNTSDITEEEIRMMVNTGNERGYIELSEREMINNVFEFDDRTAGDVMTHRTELVTCSLKDNIKDVINLAIENGFSRIPVYNSDIDDIVGILYVKDFLKLIGKKDFENEIIQTFMRPVLYVPESTRCQMLFKEFKEKKTHMAVIVDEYGGTAGIATMEDLLESIVGNIQDEYDQEEDEILPLDDDSYSLDGSLDIEEVEKLFNVKLDCDEDYDTIGGLISNTLGYIPNNDETPSIDIENIRFTVLLAEERRIIRVKAEVINKIETQTEQEN